MKIKSLFKRVQQFANEAKAAATSFFFANQFAQDKENWVQLSPFGDFGNIDKNKKRVIQRFQKPEAEQICNSFNGAGRLVTQPLGMPFYVGHPDHPRFKGQPGHTDTAAKGRGKKMEVRHADGCAACADFANSGVPCGEHGLFVQMHWSPEGEQIIANEAFHGHSVNWAAIPTGMENGVQIFRPIRVKSAGFTNEPQIPVTPATLANESPDDESDYNNKENENMIIPPKLKLIAGFKEDEDVTIEQIITALEKAQPVANETAGNAAAALGLLLLANVEAMGDDQAQDKADFIAWLHELLGTDPASGEEGLKAALQDKVTKAGHVDKVKKTRSELNKAYEKHDNARKDLETQLANVTSARDSLTSQLANERTGRATLIVEGLVKSGKILTVDREARITDLANAGDDFDTRVAEFANGKVLVKTAARSGELAGKHGVLTSDVRNRQQKFEDLMGKRAQEFPNESYEDRFNAVAGSGEGAALFAQMQRPGTAE